MIFPQSQWIGGAASYACTVATIMAMFSYIDAATSFFDRNINENRLTEVPVGLFATTLELRSL